MLRILRKLLEILLVFACLAAMAGGVYFYVTVSGVLKPNEPPKVYNAVVIVVTAPFQPLVTYPNGQKTGFDPVSGSQLTEISLSRYYFQAEESAPDPGTYWLGLTDPSDKFSLQITGEKGEFYTFGFYSFEKGIQQTQTFSGQFTSESVVYSVTSAPGQSFPWSLTLIK